MTIPTQLKGHTENQILPCLLNDDRDLGEIILYNEYLQWYVDNKKFPRYWLLAIQYLVESVCAHRRGLGE